MNSKNFFIHKICVMLCLKLNHNPCNISIKDSTFVLYQGTTNGDADGEAHDESVMNVDAEDDVDNLQLAWEMLGKYDAIH